MNGHNKEYYLLTYAEAEHPELNYKTVKAYRIFDYLAEARSAQNGTDLLIYEFSFYADSGDIKNYRQIY